MKIRRIVSAYAECVAEAPLSELDYNKKINTPELAYALFRPLLENQSQEVFSVLTLNGKNRVNGYAEISRGTLTASLVHPREVFGPAIRMGAASIIVAHNHPSGDPEPSAEDLSITDRLYEAGMMLGIPLMDHIIIGLDSFVALRSRMRWGK